MKTKPISFQPFVSPSSCLSKEFPTFWHSIRWHDHLHRNVSREFRVLIKHSNNGKKTLSEYPIVRPREFYKFEPLQSKGVRSVYITCPFLTETSNVRNGGRTKLDPWYSTLPGVMKNALVVKKKFRHTKTNTAVYLIQLLEVQKQPIRADQKNPLAIRRSKVGIYTATWKMCPVINQQPKAKW